jgi:hypothetical protein
MTRGPVDGRSLEFVDVDALITDRYLDSILAAHDRGGDGAPASLAARPAPDVRMAATLLAGKLPRLHPSFRFEEALAAQLSATAARMRLPLAAGGESLVIALGQPARLPARPPDGDDLSVGGGLDRRRAIGRPLLIGGALTSAALSLAGAAYVAWRFGRGRQSPMARAVRAVARTRPV